MKFVNARNIFWGRGGWCCLEQKIQSTKKYNQSNMKFHFGVLVSHQPIHLASSCWNGKVLAALYSRISIEIIIDLNCLNCCHIDDWSKKTQSNLMNQQPFLQWSSDLPILSWPMQCTGLEITNLRLNGINESHSAD